MLNRYGRLHNPPAATLNVRQYDPRKGVKKCYASSINFLTLQPLSRQRGDGVTAGKGEWREWEWGRSREKACGVRMRRQTGGAERENWERGGGDWVNYDQGTMSTHLARCFISSPRTCRFLSGSLWTRQWTAWMRVSGLPPSVSKTQKQPCTRIKLHGFSLRSSGGKEPTQLRSNTVQHYQNLKTWWYTTYTDDLCSAGSGVQCTETPNKGHIVGELKTSITSKVLKTIKIDSG